MTTRFRAVWTAAAGAATLLFVSLSLWVSRSGTDGVRGTVAGGNRLDGAGGSADSTVVARVSVLNGCGRPGVCAPFVRRLRERGFDVVNGMGGNADSFEFPVSVVIDRKGARTEAVKTAQALGIRRILTQKSGNPYLIENIVVVIGRDWDTLLFPEEETPE